MLLHALLKPSIDMDQQLETAAVKALQDMAETLAKIEIRLAKIEALPTHRAHATATSRPGIPTVDAWPESDMRPLNSPH